MKVFSLATATLAAGLMGGTAAQAAITGPYTVDSDTLHLWQFDKDATASPSNSLDTVSPGGVNVSNQSGATWGNSSFAGFDRAGNTSAAANSIIRSSAGTASTLTAPAGAGGAYTYEAIINIATTSGSQQIFAMDGNGGLSDRPFFFRIVNGELSLQNIANGNVDNRVDIPTTGDDAFVANEWFHVAVAYDGNEGVAGNLEFYWTRVDDSRTEANLIGTGTGVDMSTTATAVYGIGNAFRTVGGGVTSNLEGSIDEVRISGIARGADQFIFVPEPSSLAFLGLGGLLIARRRRG